MNRLILFLVVVILIAVLAYPVIAAGTESSGKTAGRELSAEESVDQKKVDEAVNKAADFLIDRCSKSITDIKGSEFVFYALLKSGVKIPEPLMQTFMDKILKRESRSIYEMAVLAMIFSELDNEKYIRNIIQCAEFLMANQNARGEWGYNEIRFPKFLNDNLPIPKPVSSTEGTGTKSVRSITIKIPARNKSFGANPPGLDISISQFAVLGLRACAESGIEIPLATWQDAEKAFTSKQGIDGGWSCCAAEPETIAMTLAGLGSMAICLYYQNKDTENDKRMKSAMDWIIRYLKTNDYKGTHWGTIYYCFYAMERAGALLNIDYFGEFNWYNQGVKYLLERQLQNGAWDLDSGPQWGQSSWDTTSINASFAILFFRRVTRALRIINPDEKDGQWMTPEEKQRLENSPESTQSVKPDETITPTDIYKSLLDKPGADSENLPWAKAREKKTKHFNIKTNLSVEALNEIDTLLECAYPLRQKFFGLPKTKEKLNVWVPKNFDEFSKVSADLSPGMYLGAGLFIPRERTVQYEDYIIVYYGGNDTSQISTVTSVLLHEFTHYTMALVHRSADCGLPPMWLNEGMPFYFETAKFDGKKLNTDIIHNYCLSTIKKVISQKTSLELKNFINLSMAEHNKNPDIYNAEGWSLIYFLFNGRNGKYKQGIEAYIKNYKDKKIAVLFNINNLWIKDKAKHIQIFEQSIGMPIDKLEKEWKEYILKLK
ncbi:MAG: DUF1570 domain-containing protein [Planctomycetota bacterium]